MVPIITQTNACSAIGITANFVNSGANNERGLREGGYVSYLDRTFFDKLNAKNYALENLVYYCSDTHYFVMTAKKSSLIHHRVLCDEEGPLDWTNVNHQALVDFVRTVVTLYGLPDTVSYESARGKEDVSLFDFSSKTAVRSPIKIIEHRQGRSLVGLIGDSATSPFWPLGTGKIVLIWNHAITHIVIPGAANACLSAMVRSLTNRLTSLAEFLP